DGRAPDGRASATHPHEDETRSRAVVAPTHRIPRSRAGRRDEWNVMSLRTELRRLASRFRGSVTPTTRGERLTPSAIVEQQRAMRTYSAAMPADEWSEDITRRNQEIADTYHAEVERRTALFERGE